MTTIKNFLGFVSGTETCSTIDGIFIIEGKERVGKINFFGVSEGEGEIPWIDFKDYGTLEYRYDGTFRDFEKRLYVDKSVIESLKNELKDRENFHS